MWLDIHRSLKFIQSFQMDVVRHAQSDSKQWVSSISKMSWDVKLIFCIWYGQTYVNIFVFDSVCSYECGQMGQMVMDMSKAIPNIESGMWQGWIEQWC